MIKVYSHARLVNSMLTSQMLINELRSAVRFIVYFGLAVELPNGELHGLD
jgi:hypothetical protein